MLQLLASARLRLAVAAVALAALAVSAVACGDDDDTSHIESQLESIQQDITAVQESLSRTSVYTAVQAMRAQDVHELNVDVQAMSSLDEATDHETRLRHTSEAVRVTHWPSDLQEAADDLAEKLDSARQAFREDDLAGAKTAVRDAHDAWHVLDNQAATYVGAEADHAPDNGDHSDHEMDGAGDSEDDERMENGNADH